jgi:hypothetical protein
VLVASRLPTGDAISGTVRSPAGALAYDPVPVRNLTEHQSRPSTTGFVERYLIAGQLRKPVRVDFGWLHSDSCHSSLCFVSNSERDCDVLPLLLYRTLRELVFDACDYLIELAVVECPYEDQAGMRSLGFGPLARQRCEVAAVMGYENALLGRRELKHLWVR